MKKGIIYGIDIARGSPKSREAPRYALAVLKDGKVSHYSMIGLGRILRMVHADRPGYLAVDNIYELASDKKGLIRLLSRLPGDVKVVQVTGGVHQTSLIKLAREQGISFDPSDPNAEAEVCALLADANVGCIVSLFEDMTRIKVSRARSPGRGGWSQNRYRRKVHGAVREKSREIESILKKLSRENDIKYESRITEGFGGYVRAEFTVYTSRTLIPVNNSSFADVQIKVSSIPRDKIKYIPIKGSGRSPVIVGVDPGTTVGIAILSLDGSLLLSRSIRGISHDEVVKMISDCGKPAIIATDVTPTPAAVEKIRRSFNAVISTPASQLSSAEKIAMARPFGYSNDHERDSMAAAVYALKGYKNIFSRIDKKVPPGLDPNRIKVRVIQGDTIAEAIENEAGKQDNASEAMPAVLDPGVDKGPGDEVVDKEKRLRDKIRHQRTTIVNLQSYIEELKQENVARENRIEKLESRLDRIKASTYKEIQKTEEISKKDRKISLLKKDVKTLKKALKRANLHISKLKQIRKMELKGEGIPVKVLRSFTKEAISDLANTLGIKKGDLIYISDPSGGSSVTARMLADMEVNAVVVNGYMAHAAEDTFFKSNVPVLKNLPLQQVDDLAMITPNILDDALEKWRHMALQRRDREEEQKLEMMVDEYRSQRRRGIE